MKIGFVSMPLSGHLNPMTALARRLQSRGNEVVFFGVPDVEPFASAAGLDFVPYGEAEYPVGSIDKLYSSVATMRGFEVVRHSCMDLNPDLTRVAFEYLAEKLTTTGVEALVIDTVHFFIELVPLSMSMPYVHIWTVLHLDFARTPQGVPTPGGRFTFPGGKIVSCSCGRMTGPRNNFRLASSLWCDSLGFFEIGLDCEFLFANCVRAVCLARLARH